MDLRIPSGWFFLLTGALLLAMAVASDSRAALTDVNVNLYAGLTMGLFGGILLWLSRKRHT